MRLAVVFLGSLARRRVATLFSFAAIVLGVALGMAVEAVHQAALTEFGRGLRTLAGAADLQVIGPRGGFDEALYPMLVARAELAAASPLVEVETQVVGRPLTLQVLGVDVFTLAQVGPALLARPAAGAEDAGREPGRAGLDTLAEDAVFLSEAAREALGISPGGRLRLHAGGASLDLRVAGDLPGAAEHRRLAVMDIAAVQAGFGRIGRLTRIDLRLAPGVTPAAARAALGPLLPPGVLLEVPEAAQAANLSRAYRVNLTMLAAIALLTGGFLVFSAQALAVVRRRTEFAFLRAIGLGRRDLFAWLLAEGALVGLLGGLVGVALGHALAWGLLSVLGGDLGAGFFAGLAPRLGFDPGASAVFVALGLLAGMAGAWLPAREAAALAPAQALKAGDEAVLTGGTGRPRLGLLVLGASLPASLLPPLAQLPIGGYLATACLLVGGVLVLPWMAALVARVLPGAGPVPVPVPVRLAVARLRAAPGHAVVAAAGVLASVALAVAMAIMVASFRSSVDEWLAQVLPADLYLRAGHLHSGSVLDEVLQARIAAVPGVARVRFTRHDSLRLAPDRPAVAVIARPAPADAPDLPLVAVAPVAPVGGGALAIWISEAVADLYDLGPGERVQVPLGGRAVEMRVAGVWRDYARQTGTLVIDLGDYRRLTGDTLVNDVAVWLAPGADPWQVAGRLTATGEPGALEVASPGAIRARSLEVFDRTFAVTYLLEAAAVGIGLAGVAASFAALAAARRREFGMLRHLGLRRREIGWMLALEGALAAAVGVLGGFLVGGAIGVVLIEVVNRQSFHWSMDLQVPWGSLAAFGLILIALAALAAVAAGRQAMRREAVLAVREDW